MLHVICIYIRASTTGNTVMLTLFCCPQVGGGVGLTVPVSLCPLTLGVSGTQASPTRPHTQKPAQCSPTTSSGPSAKCRLMPSTGSTLSVMPTVSAYRATSVNVG